MTSKLVWSGLAAAILATTSIANAADLPARGAPVYTKAPALVQVYNWTGGYAGLNIGYGWSRATADVSFPGGVLSGSENLRGINGGGQLGYNLQTGNMVYGIETDIQASGQKASSDTACPVAFCGAGVTLSETDRITWFGTTRGRLGFAADRLLAYVTGGVAYTGLKSDLCATGFGCTSQSQTKFGWTVGAGVEGALVDRWTWKLEYLYIDAARFNRTDVTAGVATTTQVRVNNNVLRTGVNYRF